MSYPALPISASAVQNRSGTGVAVGGAPAVRLTSRMGQLVAIVALLVPTSAWAADFAITDVSGALIVVQTNNGDTRGFAFMPTQDIFVDHLGVFNHDALGLHDAHLVGIWDAGGNL